MTTHVLVVSNGEPWIVILYTGNNKIDGCQDYKLLNDMWLDNNQSLLKKYMYEGYKVKQT